VEALVGPPLQPPPPPPLPAPRSCTAAAPIPLVPPLRTPHGLACQMGKDDLEGVQWVPYPSGVALFFKWRGETCGFSGFHRSNVRAAFLCVCALCAPCVLCVCRRMCVCAYVCAMCMCVCVRACVCVEYVPKPILCHGSSLGGVAVPWVLGPQVDSLRRELQRKLGLDMAEGKRGVRGGNWGDIGLDGTALWTHPHDSPSPTPHFCFLPTCAAGAANVPPPQHRARTHG
jgi:hypothetical protein